MALVDKGGYLVDDAVWKKLRKHILANMINEVQLGWFEDNKYGPSNDNLQMAQVAQWQEEGRRKTSTSGAIPERPFMRVGLAVAFKRGANTEQFKDMLKAVANGESVLTAMKRSETSFEYTLRKVMMDWSTPPNADRTVELKGFNDPLIDTSELVANVTATTEKRGT